MRNGGNKTEGWEAAFASVLSSLYSRHSKKRRKCGRLGIENKISKTFYMEENRKASHNLTKLACRA